MAKTPTLLLVALACIGGAAVLRSQAPGPRSLEPIDHMPLTAVPTPKPTPLPTALPSRQIINLPARPSASASPVASPSASGSASGSPSPSASASGSASGSPSPGSSPSGSPSPTPPPGSTEALHQQAIVVDTHVETPWWINEKKLRLRDNKGQVSLQKLKTGGVDVVFFSIYVNPAQYGRIAKAKAEAIISDLKREMDLNADMIELATSYGDIQRIVAKGKIAGLMGMEGGDPIGNSVDNVNHFYRLGVRYLGPTWSVHTQLGDSAGQPKPRWNGLSPLGKQVIKRMNEVGMLVDVSHLSDAAFSDVLKTSKQPIIASHSGVDGVRVSPRNLSNDMLKLLSVNGGVVGVLFYPPFLENSGRADLASVVKHVDHAAKVAGIDHVGLGSDFDGLDKAPPTGLADASRFPAITAELRKRGYKDADIIKVLGGNFMRVFQQVLK